MSELKLNNDLTVNILCIAAIPLIRAWLFNAHSMVEFLSDVFLSSPETILDLLWLPFLFCGGSGLVMLQIELVFAFLTYVLLVSNGQVYQDIFSTNLCGCMAAFAIGSTVWRELRSYYDV